jgi:hypothetical protein
LKALFLLLPSLSQQTNQALTALYLSLAILLQSLHNSGTWLALVYGVRRSKKQKKGDQAMNIEIITLEVEEMEEMVAPGILIAD